MSHGYLKSLLLIVIPVVVEGSVVTMMRRSVGRNVVGRLLLLGIEVDFRLIREYVLRDVVLQQLTDQVPTHSVSFRKN